jgi:hypothetical protein
LTFGDRQNAASRSQSGPAARASEALGKRRRHSGWVATFVAGLERAKQGEVVPGQGRDFKHVASA